MTKDLAVIARVRKRGRIGNEAEYRLVQDRTEQIWNDPEGKKDMEALNKLLAAYEPPNKKKT